MTEMKSPFTIEREFRDMTDDPGEWLWRLWASNGVLLVEGPRTYDKPSKARRALASTLRRIGAPTWQAEKAEVER